MGLFGVKKKNDARVLFYEGELQGFELNTLSFLLIEGDVLLISRIKPDIDVSLPLNRIKRVEMMTELEYLLIYKSTNGGSYEIPRWTLRLTYTTQNGDEKALVFFFPSQERKKVMTFVEKIQPKAPSSYSL